MKLLQRIIYLLAQSISIKLRDNLCFCCNEGLNKSIVVKLGLSEKCAILTEMGRLKIRWAKHNAIVKQGWCEPQFISCQLKTKSLGEFEFII